MFSRERAQGVILAGRVRVEGEVADKPGRMIPQDAFVEVLEDPNPYVSRGGLKLEHALKTFTVSAVGKVCADIGASTGGFTDCLIKQGASRVYAVDVGYGQLDWKLRNDRRVTILDRTNARSLTPEAFGEPLDLAVVDVAFISLMLVIPPLLKILRPEGDLIALVKPQFEVGRNEVENKGIIKDPGKHMNVLLGIYGFVEKLKWELCGLTPSPITGQKGNREFFIHCAIEPRGPLVTRETIRRVVYE